MWKTFGVKLQEAADNNCLVDLRHFANDIEHKNDWSMVKLIDEFVNFVFYNKNINNVFSWDLIWRKMMIHGEAIGGRFLLHMSK